jgi:hypothetical protein
VPLPNGMRLKLRRAEKRLIPQSTRAVSFKRVLGGEVHRSTRIAPRRGYSCDLSYTEAVYHLMYRCKIRLLRGVFITDDNVH